MKVINLRVKADNVLSAIKSQVRQLKSGAFRHVDMGIESYHHGIENGHSVSFRHVGALRDFKSRSLSFQFAERAYSFYIAVYRNDEYLRLCPSPRYFKSADRAATYIVNQMAKWAR